MTPRPGFNPDKIAFYEKAGWKAYYDRKWLRVLSLMMQLSREQFGISLASSRWSSRWPGCTLAFSMPYRRPFATRPSGSPWRQ